MGKDAAKVYDCDQAANACHAAAVFVDNEGFARGAEFTGRGQVLAFNIEGQFEVDENGDLTDGGAQAIGQAVFSRFEASESASDKNVELFVTIFPEADSGAGFDGVVNSCAMLSLPRGDRKSICHGIATMEQATI